MMQHRDDGVGTADRLLRESDPAWGLAADEAVDKAVAEMIAGVAPGRPVRRRWWRSPVFVTSAIAAVLGLGAGAAIAAPLASTSGDSIPAVVDAEMITTVNVSPTTDARCVLEIYVVPLMQPGDTPQSFYLKGTTAIVSEWSDVDAGPFDQAEFDAVREYVRAKDWTVDWSTLLSHHLSEVQPPGSTDIFPDPRFPDADEDSVQITGAMEAVDRVTQSITRMVTDAGLNTHGSATLTVIAGCTAVTK